MKLILFPSTIPCNVNWDTINISPLISFIEMSKPFSEEAHTRRLIIFLANQSNFCSFQSLEIPKKINNPFSISPKQNEAYLYKNNKDIPFHVAP